MKRKMLLLISMMFVFVFLVSTSVAGGPPQVGSILPDIKLKTPADPAERKYLGISGSGQFAVSQIKAQAVVLQVFSMYCPYCQKDAPNMNRFFDLIENNPNLKGKIKVLGIGAGNTPFEVNTFKKRYNVLFPLVPDADFTIHKNLGEVRTPYFIVVRMDGSKKPEVVYSRLGAQEDIEAFLAEIIELADLK